MASVDPKRSAAAKKGWETRRRNAGQAPARKAQPKPKQETLTYKAKMGRRHTTGFGEVVQEVIVTDSLGRESVVRVQMRAPNGGRRGVVMPVKFTGAEARANAILAVKRGQRYVA